MNALYPVILAVPVTFAALPRAEKSSWLSRYARVALALSAEKSGHTLPQVLPKDEKGTPRPVGDIHWSISHKEEFVAGLVDTGRIGIDVEKVKTVSPALIHKIVPPEEHRLFRQAPCGSIFFRCWTAKEAALKAEGSGLRHLFRCRITTVIDHTGLVVTVNSRTGDQKKTWRLSHCFFDGHVAAVAAEEDRPCCWTILNDRQEPLPAERSQR